eukprot:EG_transcript_17187
MACSLECRRWEAANVACHAARCRREAFAGAASPWHQWRSQVYVFPPTLTSPVCCSMIVSSEVQHLPPPVTTPRRLSLCDATFIPHSGPLNTPTNFHHALLL